MHGDHLDERQDRADKATGTGVCGDQMRGEGWQPARTSFDAVASAVLEGLTNQARNPSFLTGCPTYVFDVWTTIVTAG